MSRTCGTKPTNTPRISSTSGTGNRSRGAITAPTTSKTPTSTVVASDSTGFPLLLKPWSTAGRNCRRHTGDRLLCCTGQPGQFLSWLGPEPRHLLLGGLWSTEGCPAVSPVEAGCGSQGAIRGGPLAGPE